MRWIVISTDNNPDFYQYLPYIKKAWNLLGWNTLTMTVGINFEDDEKNKHYSLDYINLPIRNFSLAQISRLWGWKSNFIKSDEIIMTSDIDMLPCENYWEPDKDSITSYGHDLNCYEQYPMCYIAMKKSKWQEVFLNKNIEDVIKNYPHVLTRDNRSNLLNQHLNLEWKKYWFVDQEIITDYLKPYNVKNIERFTSQGLRRIDRNHWEETVNISNPIDCHLPRPFNKEAVETLFKKFYLK